MAAQSAITADDVRAARKEGRKEIFVPSGTLLTPLARDEAGEYGIRFVFAEGAPGGEPGGRRPARVPALRNDGAVFTEAASAIVPGQIILRAGQPLAQAFTPASSAVLSDKTGDARAGENTAGHASCELGVCMIFLTEDDIRQRAIPEGGELVLSAAEKLTPSAMEHIRERRLRVVASGDARQCCKESPPSVIGDGRAESGLTHLDAATMVAKTHPRIEARGKLDNLMAEIVLTQTLFDPKSKLPPLLKDCLSELKNWVFQTLAAEISGSILPEQSMAGMNPDALRAVSRNPRRYLALDHLTPDATLGMNMAFLNRLRTQVRETELTVAKAALCRSDIGESLNRLSSAVYVLMLFTRLAESGGKLPETGIKIG
ncbi:MAG: hypothetical protein LBR31_07125 [Desulfovibrio sp.]|jgi:ethanolamine utilization cobalamin adenosyltransferase|nr:hypothetical protein [Desulfovibrio sp.]